MVVYKKFGKRFIGVLLSLMGLIVCFIPMLVIAVLIKSTSRGPVIFKQERLGRNEHPFTIYKFRTMLPPKGGVIDPAQDAARLTPFGKKLRATSLDELPELINLIKGDMAVVGPRPLLVQYLSRYNAHQARRHEVRPGFTGLAQVHGRNAISWEEKFEWDVKYVDYITFKGDVKIILDTVKTVFKHEGISAAGEATMGEFMGSEKN